MNFEPLRYRVNPRAPIMLPAERVALETRPHRQVQEGPLRTAEPYQSGYLNNPDYDAVRAFHAENFRQAQTVSYARTKSAETDPSLERQMASGRLPNRPPVQSYFAEERPLQASTLVGRGGYIRSADGQRQIPNIIAQRIDSLNRQEGLPPIEPSAEQLIDDDVLLAINELSTLFTQVFDYQTGARTQLSAGGFSQAIDAGMKILNVLMTQGDVIPVSDLRDFLASALQIQSYAANEINGGLPETGTFAEQTQVERLFRRIVDLIEYIIAVVSLTRSKNSKRQLLRQWSRRALVRDIGKADDSFRGQWWKAISEQEGRRAGIERTLMDAEDTLSRRIRRGERRESQSLRRFIQPGAPSLDEQLQSAREAHSTRLAEQMGYVTPQRVAMSPEDEETPSAMFRTARSGRTAVDEDAQIANLADITLPQSAIPDQQEFAQGDEDGGAPAGAQFEDLLGEAPQAASPESMASEGFPTEFIDRAEIRNFVNGLPNEVDAIRQAATNYGLELNPRITRWETAKEKLRDHLQSLRR